MTEKIKLEIDGVIKEVDTITIDGIECAEIKTLTGILNPNKTYKFHELKDQDGNISIIVEPVKETKQRRRPAVDLVPRLATITNKKYSGALMPENGDNIYLTLLDDHFAELLKFENGFLFDAEGNQLAELKQGNTQKLSSNVDLTLVKSVYSLIHQYAKKGMVHRGTIEIHINDVADFLGIRLRDGQTDKTTKSHALLKKLAQFNNILAVDGQSFYALFRLNSYDKETGILNLYAGGLAILERNIIAASQRINKIKGKKQEEYTNPHHSFLIHSNVKAKCKSDNAILLAEQFIITLEQGGDHVKKFDIKASTLINRVPTLKNAIVETSLTGAKNAILKRSFTAAYRVLRENTDIYKYFNDLVIDEFVPTVSVLDTKIVVVHSGKNKEYKI